MACFRKLCNIVLLVIFVIVLLSMSPCSKASTCKRRAFTFPTDVIPQNDILPPTDGPSIMLEEPKKVDSDANVSASKPSKEAGMNKANAAWYDSIYNGGILTELPKGDPLERTAQLYDSI